MHMQTQMEMQVDMTACHTAKQDKVGLCEALQVLRAEPGGNYALRGVSSTQHSTAQQRS